MGWRARQGYADGERSVDSQIIEETFAAVGAYVMGRRMFDGGEIPWGDTPPFRAPVFVVTHRPRELLQRQGGTSFTFVTDGSSGPSTGEERRWRQGRRRRRRRYAATSGAGGRAAG